MSNYNSYAKDYLENGTDTKVADNEFNRNAKMAPVENGPFCIQRVIPGTHHTMGGGIHGTNRLGGNPLTDITVFGKLTGETVVKDSK